MLFLTQAVAVRKKNSHEEEKALSHSESKKEKFLYVFFASQFQVAQNFVCFMTVSFCSVTGSSDFVKQYFNLKQDINLLFD